MCCIQAAQSNVLQQWTIRPPSTISLYVSWDPLWEPKLMTLNPSGSWRRCGARVYQSIDFNLHDLRQKVGPTPLQQHVPRLSQCQISTTISILVLFEPELYIAKPQNVSAKKCMLQLFWSRISILWLEAQILPIAAPIIPSSTTKLPEKKVGRLYFPLIGLKSVAQIPGTSGAWEWF